MVSYYNPAAMYRQQGGVPPGGQFHSGSPISGWYPNYHHQSAPGHQQYINCMQESDQWHHQHTVFGHPDFVAEYGISHHQQQHQQQDHESQLPSPPTTVSGSDMSSPGAVGGTTSPPSHQQRPVPMRSPFEWIKKNPSLPTPGKTRTKDKYRVVYTDHQRVELEKEFYYSRYITIRRKAELASNLGLSERQVKIWFQNRRAKERKQVKKREELSHKENGPSPATPMQLQHHHHPQSLLHHQQQQQQHHQQQQQQQQQSHTVVPVPVVVPLM